MDCFIVAALLICPLYPVFFSLPCYSDWSSKCSWIWLDVLLKFWKFSSIMSSNIISVPIFFSFCNTNYMYVKFFKKHTLCFLKIFCLFCFLYFSLDVFTDPFPRPLIFSSANCHIMLKKIPLGSWFNYYIFQF